MNSIHLLNQGLLAERLRPNLSSLNLLVGSAKRIWQRDCTQWLKQNKFHMILWGPPGSGKTTLARLLGEASTLHFTALSAVRDGVKEIRHAVQEYPNSLIFIDEIHRLSRTQQDALLPILEYAEAWIIGATTESPQVSLSAPILSRVRNIYVSAISEKDIIDSLNKVIELLNKQLNSELSDRIDYIKSHLIPKIAKMSAGDLRFAINLLENCVYCQTIEEENYVLKNSLKSFSTKNHYDYISAMIKSMRGSDPDAALFYAMISLDNGEDPLFILRRCIVFASEDVGNADPSALNLALNAFQAVEYIGLPEGRIPIAQCVTYLASTQKSNRSYLAIERVRSWRYEIESAGKSLEPPSELTLKGNQQYKYPHDYPQSFIHFDYLPVEVSKIKVRDKFPAYLPSDEGKEHLLRQRLSVLWRNSKS